jgi:hypothetical protein
MTLLAVDPGKWQAGVAFFGDDDMLIDAQLVKSRSRNPAQAAFEIGVGARAVIYDGAADEVACEMPNIRSRMRQKGDPNDLLFLTLVNGAVWASVPTEKRTPVPVNDWKGSVPKEIMRGRLTGLWGDDPPLVTPTPKLTHEELEILGLNPNHNVLDAVGIGLWALHRL